MIALIAVLVGIATAFLASMVRRMALRIQIERRVDAGINAVSRAYGRGLTGIVLYLAEKIGGVARRIRHPRLNAYRDVVRSRLTALGHPFDQGDPYTFIGVQVVSGVGMGLFFCAAFGTYFLPALCVVAALGCAVPYALLDYRLARRREELSRQIPDFLDLLVMMMDAGMDFSRAFERGTHVIEGALSREFRAALEEISVGTPRVAALRAVGTRLAYAPVTTVIATITTALETGGGMAGTLREQARQSRREQFLAAEKRAAEAPLKLMLPLILLIFPTIFIILFGPIALSFLGGGLF